MNQLVINDALIQALKSADLDTNSESFRSLLLDATLLVRGQEIDDRFEFTLMKNDADMYVLDTYTSWSQLTGDETVFSIRFQELMNAMRELNDIDGLMINNKIVLSKESFFHSNKLFLAALTADDTELEEHLIPLLAKDINRAYVGKMIQGDHVQLQLVVAPWTEGLQQEIEAEWHAYIEMHAGMPDIRVVSEESDEGEFMMAHFSPVFSK